MRVGDRVGRRRAAAPSVVRALVLHAVITLMQVRHSSLTIITAIIVIQNDKLKKVFKNYKDTVTI